MIRAVCWDHDGTLIDSITVVVMASNAVRRSCGLPDASRDQVVAGMVLPTAPRMGELCAIADPDHQQRLAAAFYDAARDAADQARPYPGAAEAVFAFEAAGLRQGMVSNNEGRFVRRVCTACGLTKAMQVILGEEDVAAAKPAGDGIRQAAAALDVALSELVYIGDSRTDFEAARAAGVRSIAACWGPHPRDELARLPFDAFADEPGAVGGIIAAW